MIRNFLVHKTVFDFSFLIIDYDSNEVVVFVLVVFFFDSRVHVSNHIIREIVQIDLVT